MSSRSFVVCVLLVLLSLGCRSESEPTTTANTPTEVIVSSTPPFQTKEPERYRATRTITITTAAGKNVVTKTLIAKDGERRRNESDGMVYLELPEGRFVLVPGERVYAGVVAEPPDLNTEEQVSPESLLHADTGSTSYQNLGNEVIDGRNTNKYRVRVNSSNSQNVRLSETLIWIDEALKMPIRSETTSPDGTRIQMELSDLNLDAGPDLFQIPEDYEKIAFGELRLRRMKTE
jgi:outer membrane lipoprotein-sorting protein